MKLTNPITAAEEQWLRGHGLLDFYANRKNDLEALAQHLASGYNNQVDGDFLANELKVTLERNHDPLIAELKRRNPWLPSSQWATACEYVARYVVENM